ncbi:MAG: tripartite tricarboxylate transporter substrate binding protein [Hydrogenophaga sp.]|uniref:tripartite tricarboxylate transporter substrate binding protein n=1 Tax=Hydrogenophaga sp. TaxID=1904254 RepID=UPI0025BBE2D9|nr:tripartite tricarboxylate transporter substrate binding protein [Hydrogenophaga sp.]MBT9554141.1 tripartite tricarboxylate transporter substrate binding protein [Hydrogenophaga sp.]
MRPIAPLPTMKPHTDLPPPCPPTGVRRRDLLAWGAGSLLPLGSLAQTPPAAWPSKPVQLIVPWPAGGQTDLTLRILCEETEPLLGQPIVVVNKPGAAGTLVAPALKAAEPDGHTIGQVPITVYRHALMNHVPWDPVADLAPIVQVSGVSFGLLVPASSPFKSATELIDWAIKHPGELILGSTGIGTTAHLAMEDILLQHNVSYVHVPYKGTADQMLAIAGAQIMAGVNSTGFAPWVDRGQLRLLATFNAARNPRWPDAPTMRELGYPQAIYTSPWGLAAPAGTPPAVVQKLHDAFHKAMYHERHTSALAKYDQSLDYLNTRDYRQAVLATVEREKKLLARMNLLAKPA